MMKIIAVDNFDRETRSDVLIAENVQYFAEHIVNCLNKKFSGNYSPDYFKAVEDDYQLYKYVP